ncbi:glycosyl hydrolase family 71-domain-containing protein [Aspergillus recurvatus]
MAYAPTPAEYTGCPCLLQSDSDQDSIRLLAALASALACGASLAEAKAVFAHLMVGNAKSLGLDDWRTEIGLAQGAGIDAFVLNIANEDATNGIALPIAFTAAYDMGFQLLFSFDYAGNGAWDKSVVIGMINEYGSKETDFKNDGNPFVSTSEGPDNADDWKDIKKETDCFFMPDWSSVGAQPAVNQDDGIADGLFSWDAWPKGPANMTTYPDTSYYDFLGEKPYMMPISPWFYMNLPRRWQQAISLDRQPDCIEIIRCNDYGESYYIGPLDHRQYQAFDIGRAPFNYAKDMPHDGWRETLPYYISMYKDGSATVTEERLVAWYRVNKNEACSNGGTTGNTASQLQFEYSPNEIMEDRVFYDVLLTNDAQVTVSIGGVAQAGTWDQEPYGRVGVYHGSVPIGTASGQAVVTVKRRGETIATVTGAARGPSINPVKTKGDLSDLDCVKGFGLYEFIGGCYFAYGRDGALPRLVVDDYGLCKLTCEHGYCPDVCGSRPIGEDGVDGDGDGNDQSKYPTVTLDPTVWTAPTAQCPAPCVLVLPPSPLASPTTISFSPWKTSLEFGYTATETVDSTKTTHYTATTITTEISIPPVTTDVISFSEVVLTTTIDGGVPFIIIPSPSVSRPPSGPVAVIPTETGPLPTTVFPTETVSWVRDWVDEPKATEVADSGGPVPVVPCWLGSYGRVRLMLVVSFGSIYLFCGFLDIITWPGRI